MNVFTISEDELKKHAWEMRAVVYFIFISSASIYLVAPHMGHH